MKDAKIKNCGYPSYRIRSGYWASEKDYPARVIDLDDGTIISQEWAPTERGARRKAVRVARLQKWMPAEIHFWYGGAP